MSVIVRFAPSPTGYIHIGNLRAALLNYLFALKHNGQFILRIDDTDLERSEEKYESAIKEDLEWLGINNHTTFNQSSRFDRYNEAIQHLKSSERLYPCFETQEELDFMRKSQLSQGKPPIYNRQALNLSKEAKQTLIQEGKKPHWRFKLREGETKWQDLIRGEVKFHDDFASDPVLIRADGVPLYTLPSVVDDMDYGITHIIRGEDHVTNTAVQVQILEALSDLPNTQTSQMEFAHFSLIVDASGQGFSKRKGDLSLRSLREDGIEPMAIHSLLAKLGTSEPVAPRHTLEELANELDFSKFSRASPKFAVEDIHKINSKYLHSLPFGKIEARLKEVLPDITKPFWDAVGGNVNHLSELDHWWSVCHGSVETKSDDADFIETALNNFPKDEWNEDTWQKWTTSLKEITGRKGKELFMPLRLALTGKPHGPEMKRFLPLINKQLALTRLKSAAENR